MYKVVEGNLRMTANEATERFPDNYIAMRMDSRDLSHRMGTVLYIGDDGAELLGVLVALDDPSLCGVSEGLNLQCSLGGIMIGE